MIIIFIREKTDLSVPFSWELLKEGIEDFELLRIVDSKQKKEAIDMAVRNRDGRQKSVTDFENARKLLIQQ